MDDKMSVELAKKASGVMFTAIVGMAPNVQLEATTMLLKALFMASVKKEHRLSVFNTTVQQMRKDIKEHMETGVAK